jgi:cyclopropane fatty-acyl-phospholipid synthase-like methyltransferase
MKKKIQKSVPSEVYSEEYYAKINDGGAIFHKHAGKIIPRRMKVCVKLAKVQKNDVVLDFGCGRGDMVFFLSDKCQQVTGVDYSKSAISICEKTKEKNYKKSHNITFHQSTVSALKLKDNSFDKIFLIDVVEHLYNDELNLLLKKLYKSLKKDGVLIIHTAPNLNFY